MNKKNQLLISFIMLLCSISAIVFIINFRTEKSGRKSYKEVNIIIPEYKSLNNAEVYDKFLNNFNCHGKAYYYSFIKLDGYDYPILLLTDGVYNNSDGRKVSIGTDIYYPVDNEITKFGGIGSDGTAYPLSANTTGIFTAGGHEVTKYGLDIQNRKLKLISKYIMFFYTIGDEVNAITIGIIGNEKKIADEEEFDKAYKVC